MTVEELVKEGRIGEGSIIWTAKYDFKGGGSDFMYSHIKPSPCVVTGCYGIHSVNIRYISRKTGQELTKTAYLNRFNQVFLTEEECVEYYKGRLTAHIADKQDLIADQNVRIEKLREKIATL